MTYLVPDLLEEIFLRLPFKSLLKFKTVSKQWKSILESKRFRERRMEVKKKPKILAVGDHRTESRRFQRDEEGEMEMVYMNCDAAATRPLLTCDGLVCIPFPGWVNVLNPSTRQVISFPSAPDPGPSPYPSILFSGLFTDPWWDFFPGFWEMGFGRDIVSGSYKIVRMYLGTNHCFQILDVNIGEWRKLSPPPSYTLYSRRKPACVNGSIYWLELNSVSGLLAIDLHTEMFRLVPQPLICSEADQVVNLEGRLAVAKPDPSLWKLEIQILDAQEKNWTLAYSINLQLIPQLQWKCWYRPVAVSKQGNLYFHNSEKRLFKYYPETDSLRCLSSNICVVSPFVENLVSLRPSSVSKTSSRYQSGFHSLEHAPRSLSSKILRRIKLWIPDIVFFTSVASLVVVRHFVVQRRS